jgi:hypothetical protein
MNEQAIRDAYDLFVKNGYSDSIDDFKKLIASDSSALNDSYNLFKGNGYTDSIEDYKSLMGLSADKKKVTTALPSASGSLAASKTPTERVSVGPMGMVGLERTKEYKPDDKQGWLLNTVSSLDKGFYKNLVGNPVKGLGTLLEGATGKGFVSDALIKFGNYFNNAIDELTPQDEEFKNSLSDQFGQAFGQVVSLATTAGAGALGAAGKGAAGLAEAQIAAKAAPKAITALGLGKAAAAELASPTAVSAGLSMGQSEFDRAKEAGATDDQAFEAFYKNAVVGSVLEKVPVMQFMKRFNKSTAGGLTNYIKTKGVAGLTGGVEEMTTEVLQGLYANLAAKDIYNVNQDIYEGLAESGGVGLGVGFLLNAMGANAKILRKQGKEEEANVVEAQINELESRAKKGGKSSYKMGGVKIESADVISKMIDEMDANDLVKANIEIKNDPELNKKLQEKIVVSSVKEQVRQGNPDLNEPSLDAITKLELELRKLEGNTTQTGKDKAAAIRTQIKNIQENQLTEEVDNSARIAELEGVLSSAEKNLAETGTSSLSEDARTEIEKELQDLKTKQNVQKQTAGEVPVQPRAGVSETLEEGKPQAEPQVPPAEGVQAEVVQEEVDQEVERNRLSDKVFEAKKNIARASDTEAAIEEYNTAKKELDDFDASVEQAKDKRRAQLSVQNIIEDEKIESQKAGYEYKELYDQDPRLAALQSSKDLLEFIKSNNLEEISAERGETIEEAKKSQERSISYIEQNIADLEVDLEANPVVSLKTQEVAPVEEVAPVTEAALEIEQYEPITESQVSHEKKFTKDNAIDYEEDTRFTDSGREVTYLSRVTVEAIDDNTGDAIGGLVKIVDEDKNVSWQALDIDGNELGKQDFDSLEEAKTALVNNWNKVQKKEFDKEVKRKAKTAEKEAAKQAKKQPVQAPVQEGPTAEEISEIDALLDLDIEDEDNMQIVLNALDNADKAITKRLRSGANDALLAIPLSTVQVVIKAVKTLVKGGMILRDAIKKVAADNNLTESKVSDIFNAVIKEPVFSDLSVEGTGIKLTGNEDIKKGSNAPTVTKIDGYQDDYSEEDILNEEHAPNSRVITHASNIASGEISYTKKGEKITFKLPYVNKAAVKKINSLREKYRAVKGTGKEAKVEKDKLKKEINKVAKQVLKDFTDTMTQNLLALYDTLTPEFVANSKDWYVGANRMANAIAQKYNMTVDQVGGIIAVLSPQNDWFNNVSVAERVINIMTKYGDTKLTKDVVDKAVKYNSRTGEPNNFANDLLGLYNQYGEVSINELEKLGVSPLTQSAILRAFDQGLNSPKVAITDPQGLFVGFDKTPVRWNSEAEISKAIGIFRNGDINNINENLGDGNKVRNFYNNIVDPNSKTPYLTADTHALSAALNGPISANDAGGFGLFNGSLEPAYALVKSAYIKAAKIAGIKPREMQSITWEAQRIGINDKNRTEKNKQETFEYIEQSRTNEKTSYERATELISKNRSADPEWGKSRGIKTQKSNSEILEGAEVRSKQRVGSISDLRGRTTGGLGDVDTEVGTGVTGGQTIDEVLDLDVNEKDNMDVVFGFIDNIDNKLSKRLRGGANDALLALPLSTVQLVVKTLKTLVKGGMLLRDAIRKVSADNNISAELVKDILNISEIQDGFNALMDKVGAMIDRQTRRGTPETRMISNIDTLVRNSEVYQNASDSQKKILEREARSKAGAPARRAPSIGRILGVLKDITNVSREDKLKIISQIRQLSKDAAKDLASEIRDLAKTGKITVNQAANIVARFGKVNMLSEISVSKFVDYMTKVFNDAEYNAKLSSAKNLKKDIAKLSKNKDKDANLRDLGQEFIKIDPSMVENIDEYNDMASKIKEAITGSRLGGKQKVSFASTVNVQDATAYIKDTLAAQDKMMREEKAAEIQSLMGIDVSEFSYDDMMMLLESDKPITKYNEGIIRDTINRAFGIYSSIIKDVMRTGKDPFTGEDIKFTESQKDVVNRFMEMDLNILKPKEALQAVDALANFLQNQSTAKMEAVVSRYTGLANAKEVNSKGIKAFPLKKYWSKTIGRILGEQTTNLNVLFERMFKGFNKGGMVMDKMGLTKLINKKASAEKEANNIVDRYVNLFYDKKANGEEFNSAYNNIERGMASFMMRNVIGTEQEMKAEFDRRKGLIEESISELEKGNDKEKAKAELYKKAYENILAESNTIDDVVKKVDKVNLEGVDFWMNEWNNKYDQLSDVAENVYNKKLDKDINYTPDRYFKLSSDTGTVEITEDDSAFLVNSGVNNLYQRETGVLMTATRPDSLPVSPESGDVNRYIDLSFDNNNANSMYDALVDINTAAPIRQIQAFLNSSDYKKIVPTSEDAKILKDRIQLYVRNIRDKNPYSNDELSSVVRKLNRIAAIGVGQALGGVTQPLKQVIPVALNTIVNAGGLDISATFNKAKNDFINKSGYSIANRGLESQAQVESLNRLMEEVSKSKGQKLIKKIEELNKKWLDIFLVKPDVFIARASWLSYYEKYLNDNGIDTKGIDYNTHKLNEDAANYAQRMVDRQQNVSDTDLAGKLFADRGSANQLLVKTLMPFASFRMNQAARLGADLATLTNKTSSKEDKVIAARSLAGFGVEAATFRLVSIGVTIFLGSLAKEIMGVDEDDEEKNKRIDNIIKGAKTGTFTDVFSPIPIADKLIQKGGALITQSIEDATGLPIAIYSPKKEEYLQGAGLFGISLERLGQLREILSLSVTGKYTDDFGKEKTISPKAQDGLKMLIVPALMTNTGLAPSEVNSVIRYAIKDSKKVIKTAEEKEQEMERKEQKEEMNQQKIDALENAKKKASNQKLRDAIDEKIYEIEATPEEKKEIEAENKEERLEKQDLLYDSETGTQYDTETELKRYNKRLWEQNFGVRSEWYKSHKAEKEATKLMNQEIRRMEDKEYGYIPASKKKRNSDGSLKRTSGNR